MDTLSVENMAMCENGYTAQGSNGRGVAEGHRACVLAEEEHESNRQQKGSLHRISSPLDASYHCSRQPSIERIASDKREGYETGSTVMTQCYENQIHRQSMHDAMKIDKFTPGQSRSYEPTVSEFLSENRQIEVEHRSDVSLGRNLKYVAPATDRNSQFWESIQLKNSGHSQNLLTNSQLSAMNFQGGPRFSEVPATFNLLSREVFHRQQQPSVDMAEVSAKRITVSDFEAGSRDIEATYGFSLPSERSVFSEKIAYNLLSPQENSAPVYLNPSTMKSKLDILENELKKKQKQQITNNDKLHSVAISEKLDKEAAVLEEISDDTYEDRDEINDSVLKDKNNESTDDDDDDEEMETDDEDELETDDDENISNDVDKEDEKGAAQSLGKTPEAVEENALSEDDEASVKSVESPLTVPLAAAAAAGRRFQCTLCSKSYKFKKGLKRHMKSHSRHYACFICNAGFDDRIQLKRHLLSHSVEKSPVVPDLASVSQSVADVRSDDNVVRAFPCTLCSYKAKQKKDLTKHMLVHTASKSHKCQLCKFSSKRKYSLHRHLMTVHSTARIYECTLCSFKISAFDGFKAHMAAHVSSCTTSCVVCGTVIKERANLLEHLLSHSMIQKNACKKCEKIYFKSHEYMRHMLSHKGFSFTDQGDVSHGIVFGQGTSSGSEVPGSTSRFLTQESKDPVDTPLMEAKLSHLSTMVSRLADITKSITLPSEKSRVAIQLAEMSALATELAVISSGMLQPYKNTCGITNDTVGGKSRAAFSVCHDTMDDSSFMDDDFGLTAVAGMDATTVKEELQDNLYPPLDANMQIQVDFNGEAVSCIQQRERVRQGGGTSYYKRDKHMVCTLCNLVLTDSCHLKRHLMVHVDARPYSCEKCGQSFKRKEHRKKHMVTHSEERPFACSECQYRSKTEDKLKIHMSCHAQNKEFACQFCNFSGATGHDLSQHMKRHVPQTCPQCSCVCYSRAEWKKHLLTHSSFDCTECDFTTDDRKEYTRHLKKHSMTQYLCCELCGYSCDTMRKFQYHKLRHENKTPFECPDCDYKCSSRASYDCHRLKHAGLKPYLCCFCGASFIKTSHLNQHMLIHKDEKAYRCSMCGYSCRTKHNLKEHEMTHTGKKPYVCKYCNFSFRRKKAMMLHMVKHECE